MWTSVMCCWPWLVGISQSLEGLKLGEAKGLRGLLQGAAKILMNEIELEGSPSSWGWVSGNSQGELSLSAGIGKITARAKSDATLRDRLNQFLGPQKNQLLEAINEELLKPAIAHLLQQGKRGPGGNRGQPGPGRQSSQSLWSLPAGISIHRPARVLAPAALPQGLHHALGPEILQ
nr:hypothetical protein [Halomicronema hongdechloris]